MTIELDPDQDPAAQAFTIRASQKELETLKQFIDYAIEVKDSGGVHCETDFSPITLTIYCEAEI
jgi:deoxyribose-phosphate aldolase